MAPSRLYGLAVDHRVFGDVDDESGIFARIAEARREWHLRAEALAILLRNRHQQRSQEKTRGNGVDTDRRAGEIASRRKRHADDTALGRRIGHLSDLPLEGGDAGRVDDQASLLADRLETDHSRRRKSQHVERADQIDLDHLAVFGERKRAFLSDRLARGSDPGTVDQYARRAMGGRGFVEDRTGRSVGDVATQGQTADLRGHLPGAVEVDVQHSYLRALAGQCGCGRRSETRSATGNDGCNTRYVHSRVPFAFRKIVNELPAAALRRASSRPTPRRLATRFPVAVTGCRTGFGRIAEPARPA